MLSKIKHVAQGTTSGFRYLMAAYSVWQSLQWHIFITEGNANTGTLCCTKGFSLGDYDSCFLVYPLPIFHLCKWIYSRLWSLLHVSLFVVIIKQQKAERERESYDDSSSKRFGWGIAQTNPTHLSKLTLKRSQKKQHLERQMKTRFMCQLYRQHPLLFCFPRISLFLQITWTQYLCLFY